MLCPIPNFLDLRPNRMVDMYQVGGRREHPRRTQMQGHTGQCFLPTAQKNAK